jgi:hypothetical protein
MLQNMIYCLEFNNYKHDDTQWSTGLNLLWAITYSGDISITGKSHKQKPDGSLAIQQPFPQILLISTICVLILRGHYQWLSHAYIYSCSICVSLS